jgi:hypothetical protein
VSFNRLTRLLASGTACAALAVGALTLTPDAADAASAQTAPPMTATYSCNLGLLGTFDVPASFSIPGLPTQVPAGVALPAQPVAGTLTLPAGLLTVVLILANQTLDATVGQFLFTIGAGQAAVALTGTTGLLSSLLAGAPLQMTGTLAPFTPLLPGSLPIALPSSFNLSLLHGLVTTLGVCTLKGTSTPTTVTVSKQTSKVSGKVVGKQVQQGQRAKLAVKVKRQVGKAAGRVVATLKGKVVGKAELTKGKARMTLKKLGVGLSKVQVTYLGDSITNTSTKTVRVRVVR